MTQILSDFDFGQNKGRKPQYPWKAWSDGQIRKIVKGADFTCLPTSMQVQIYNKAREKGMTAQVSIVDHDTNIVFRMVRPEPAL